MQDASTKMLAAAAEEVPTTACSDALIIPTHPHLLLSIGDDRQLHKRQLQVTDVSDHKRWREQHGVTILIEHHRGRVLFSKLRRVQNQ